MERFVVEGLRTDSLMMGNLRVSQVFAIFSAIVALIIMLVVLQKKKASNDPEYLKLYVDTEEAQLIREGKFYGKKQPDWAENPVHTEMCIRDRAGAVRSICAVPAKSKGYMFRRCTKCPIKRMVPFGQ